MEATIHGYVRPLRNCKDVRGAPLFAGDAASLASGGAGCQRNGSIETSSRLPSCQVGASAVR